MATKDGSPVGAKKKEYQFYGYSAIWVSGTGKRGAAFLYTAVSLARWVQSEFGLRHMENIKSLGTSKVSFKIDGKSHSFLLNNDLQAEDFIQCVVPSDFYRYDFCFKIAVINEPLIPEEARDGIRISLYS